MAKYDPFLIFELLKNVTFCANKKNINQPLFSLTLIHSLTAKKSTGWDDVYHIVQIHKSRARFTRSQFVYSRKKWVLQHQERNRSLFVYL